MHIETVSPAPSAYQQAAHAVAGSARTDDEKDKGAKDSGQPVKPAPAMPTLGPVTGGRLAELLSPETLDELNAMRAGEVERFSDAAQAELQKLQKEYFHDFGFSGAVVWEELGDEKFKFTRPEITNVSTGKEVQRLREEEDRMYLDGTLPISEETKKWLGVLDKLEAGVYVELSSADMEKMRETLNASGVMSIRDRLNPPLGGSQAQYRHIVKTIQSLDRGESPGLSEDNMQRMKAYMLSFEARSMGPAYRTQINFLEDREDIPSEMVDAADKLHPARVGWLSNMMYDPNGKQARDAAERLGELGDGVVYMKGASAEDVAKLKELTKIINARRRGVYNAAAAQGLSGLEIYKKLMEYDASLPDEYGNAKDRALGNSPGSWKQSKQASRDFLNAFTSWEDKKQEFTPEARNKRYEQMQARIDAGLTRASMTVG